MGHGKVTHRIQIGRECRHRMRIVSNIQNQGGLPGNDLESTRQFNARQPDADRLRRDGKAFAQRLEHGQHAGR